MEIIYTANRDSALSLFQRNNFNRIYFHYLFVGKIAIHFFLISFTGRKCYQKRNVYLALDYPGAYIIF